MFHGFTILALLVAVHRNRVVDLVRLCAIVGALAVACAPGAPGGPTQGVKGVEITPRRDALRMSEEVQLSVSIDGRPAIASWSSSDDKIVAIEPNGLARGVAIGSAAVSANAANQTATLTVRVVQDYRGNFVGRMEQTGCRRVSGSGPLSDCQPGLRSRFILTIDQQLGASVSGVLDVFQEPTVGSISGTINTDSHLVITGSARNAEYQVVLTIEQWDSQLTDSGTRLIGTFSADAQFLNGFGPQHWKEEFKFLDVLRQ